MASERDAPMSARDIAAEFRKSTFILNICLAASASPKDLGEALDMFEVALESALTAEREKEREACAKVAESPGFIQAQDTDWDEGVNYAKSFIAEAIRSRQTPTGTGE